jgi:hypothetical protein
VAQSLKDARTEHHSAACAHHRDPAVDTEDSAAFFSLAGSMVVDSGSGVALGRRWTCHSLSFIELA